MTRYHNVDGNRIPFTAEEESLRDSEEQKAAEEIALYNAKQYARDRQNEYPPIGDQLDALFHAGVFPADMAAQIQAVKDKYPKG